MDRGGGIGGRGARAGGGAAPKPRASRLDPGRPPPATRLGPDPLRDLTPETGRAAHPLQVPAPEGASSVNYQLLSPDGRNLAFVATVDGVASIWVRPLDSLEAHPLRGTESLDNDDT